MTRRIEQGDTIIEMVLAFAIFSLAAVGTMSILTNGVAITQRNLESTLVQQQIDTQAELIRHIHDTKDSLWQDLINADNLTASPAALDLGGTCPAAPNSLHDKGFFIQPVRNADPTKTTFERQSIDSATYRNPSTYAQVDYTAGTSSGVWVQATRAEARVNGVMAYDFYIHGCWGSIGLNRPMTMGTIVRLYEK